jgi:hypothetical protein
MQKPDLILHSHTSQLFILRLWVEKGSQDQQHCIYGKIQHAPVGDCLYFRNWEMLIDFLEQQISRQGKDEEPE